MAVVKVITGKRSFRLMKKVTGSTFARGRI